MELLCNLHYNMLYKDLFSGQQIASITVLQSGKAGVFCVATVALCALQELAHFTYIHMCVAHS